MALQAQASRKACLPPGKLPPPKSAVPRRKPNPARIEGVSVGINTATHVVPAQLTHERVHHSKERQREARGHSPSMEHELSHNLLRHHMLKDVRFGAQRRNYVVKSRL